MGKTTPTLIVLLLLLLSSAIFSNLIINAPPALQPAPSRNAAIPITVVVACNPPPAAPAAPCTPPLSVTFTWADATSGIAYQTHRSFPVAPGAPVTDSFACSDYADCPASLPPNNLKLTVVAADGAVPPLPPAQVVLTTSVHDQPASASIDAPATYAQGGSFNIMVHETDADDDAARVQTVVSIFDASSATKSIGTWAVDGTNAPSGISIGRLKYVSSATTSNGQDYNLSIDCTGVPGCVGLITVVADSNDPSQYLTPAQPAPQAQVIIRPGPPLNAGPALTITSPYPNDQYPPGTMQPQFTVEVDDNNAAVNGFHTTITVNDAGGNSWSWDSAAGANTLQVAQRGGKPKWFYDATITCPAGGCMPPISIMAQAAELAVPIPQSGSGSGALSPTGWQPTTSALPAPILAYSPNPAQATDNIMVTAVQPANSPAVTSYQFTWVPSGQAPQGDPPVPADAGGLSGSGSFQCTPAICAGSLTAIVTPLDASGAGGSASQLTIDTGSRHPPAPIVVSITPDPGGLRLAALKGTGGSAPQPALITPSDSLYMQLGPPSTSPPTTFDSYTYTIYKNGELQLGPAGSASGQINVNCQSMGCKEGDYVRVEANGSTQGLQSLPGLWSFTVQRPQDSFIPNALLCVDASWNDWLRAMLVGLGAMAAVIALVWMAGEALHQPHFLDWAKTELLQLGISLILFFLIVWLVRLECGFPMGSFLTLTGQTSVDLGGGRVIGATTTPMEAAQNYLLWSMEQTHLTIATLRYDMGALNIRATYSTYKNQFPILGMNGFSQSPYAGDWTVLGSLGMLLQLNTTFLVASLMQFFTLLFFVSSQGLFLLLVPIALVLRSVPFLRPLGGSLAAIAVGFYIFYPLVFGVLSIVVPPLYIGHDASDFPGGFSSAAQAQAAEQDLTGSGITSYFFDHPNPRLQQNPDAPYPLNFYPIGEYYRLTALNFMRAILLPTAALLMAAAFVRDLSAIFGEEVDATRLLQMI